MEENFTMHKRSNLSGRRSVLGGFIAAHGLMHAVLLNAPRPEGGAGNFVTRGGEIPLLNSFGLGASSVEAIGGALMLVSAVGLLLAALMYARQSKGWDIALMASSALSVASLLLLWNDWMVMGPIIGLGLMVLAIHSRLAEVA